MRSTVIGKTTVLILLAVLALPVGPAGARVVVPPGNAEADQYFETIPGAAGPTTPNPERTPEDAVRDGTLSAATNRALERRGSAGQALATLVAQTAPKRVKGGSSGNAGGPFPKVALGPVGGGGLGALFPLILASTVAAALAFAIERRRRSARPRG